MRNMTIAVRILLVLQVGTAVQAELQFVDNFDGMTTGNMPYNIPTAGGGGIWSTNTGGTSGNIVVEANSGSNVIRFMTTSDGVNSRGFGFADIDNAIENTESGLLFFRFCIRAETNAADTYFGIHALSGVTPFAPAGNSPQDYLVAGFRAVNGTGTLVDLVKIKDASAVLMAGLSRGQWYNCWIDADNTANTYDLYVSAASGPAGAPVLPSPTNRIAEDLPFENTAAYGNSSLMGAFFDTPRLSSTTRSTTQSARTFIDEVWWDGDAGLIVVSKGARNPIPNKGAEQVSLDQVLSWDAPDDPNVEAVLGYDVYFSNSQPDVQNGEPTALVSASQTVRSYKPVLAYDTQYFWRIETTVRMDDPNHTVLVDKGKIWDFTTMSSLPTITQQPTDVIAQPGQTIQFAIAAESVSPALYQWYKSADRSSSTPADDTPISNAAGAVLTLSNVSAADEAFYFCKVYNPSVVYSDAASLGVQRELAHWTLDQSNYDAGNQQYLDSVGGHHAAIAVLGSEPVFIDGIVVPASNGAAVFDSNTYGVVSMLNPSEFTGQLTLSVWVLWDGTNLPEYGNVILQKGTSYDTWMWSLKLRQSEGTRAGIRFYNNFGYSVQTANLVEANVWTHVCATWDGTTARIYINGTLASSDGTGTMGTDTLGAMHIASSDNFPGAMDDVRIFNTAYDASAIALDLYYPVTGRPACVNPSDPILALYDVSGDCIVNLADFALLASHWMDCRLVPECIERPQ